MAAVINQDAWMEKCLISIAVEGGSDVQFATLTETVDFDLGEKDIEGIALVNGGRVTQWSPEGDSTITFEAYPLEAGTTTGTAAKGFFDLLYTKDATAPIRISTDHKRNKHRVLVLWTNDATVTTAQSATTNTHSAKRFGFANVHFTSVKPSFTDGILKYTVTGKCTPFDKAAVANKIYESCAGADGTDILPAIAAYTTASKFG